VPIEQESTSVRRTSRTKVPKPRNPGVDLDAPLPRHWLGGNVVATHIANGVNLLFPAGERFFVRTVNRFLPRIEDELLRAQARGFFGQEGRHAKEHDRVFALLEEQGYDVKRFLRLYEAIAYGFIERVAPSELALATTAACEHYTALLAEDALTDGILDRAHPTMRALLLWHAAEEIEHRSVAFDVLQKVNPSLGLRAAGLAMATACLGGFWVLSTTMLLAQEKGTGLPRIATDWRIAREQLRGRGVFLRGLRAYLKKDFHPSQSDLDALAADYLAAAGLS
jgi:predicted metal-dependent hydrolase